MPQTDPFAAYGGASLDTPAPTPAAPQPSSQPQQSDPFAAYGGASLDAATPAQLTSTAPPQETAEDKFGRYMSMTTGLPGPEIIGAVKGLAETGHTIGAYGSQLLNAVGVSVPKISTESPEYLQAHGVEQTVGKVGEGLLEFFLGDEALKGLSLTDKLKQATQLTQLVEKYPTIAKALHIGASAMRMSAVGTAQGLAHGEPLGQAAESGAVTGLAGGTLEGARAITASGASPYLKAAARAAELGTGAGFAAKGATDVLTPQQPGETEQQATERRVQGGVQAVMGGKQLGEAVPKPAEISRAATAAQRITGTGGLAPAESLEKALRPYISEKYFKENVESVLPRLAEENKITKITDPDGMAEAAYNAKNKLWNNEIAPPIEENKNEVISGNDIAKEIKDGVSASVRKHQPNIASKIDEWADTFKGDYKLGDASQAVTDFNQKLRSFYKLSPSEQFGVATAQPEMGMLQDATDAMRSKIEEKLDSLGAMGSADLRKQYGALNQLQRVSEKRAVVYGRQAPINLPQVIGGVGAAISGHPMAAAIPFITKWLNSPEHLISSAMKEAGKLPTPETPSVTPKVPINPNEPTGPVSPAAPAPLAPSTPPTVEDKRIATSRLKEGISDEKISLPVQQVPNFIGEQTPEAPAKGVSGDAYRIPTGKLLEIPKNRLPRGFTPEAVLRHEYAHSIVGHLEGLEPTDIISHKYAGLGSTGTAATRFDSADFRIDKGGQIPIATIREKMGKVLTTLMAGAAANELYDGVPFKENKGLVGDISYAKNMLKKNGGYTDAEADVILDKHFQLAKNHLTHQATADIMNQNVGTREENLPDTHHASAGRIQQILKEVDRVRNEKPDDVTRNTAGNGQLIKTSNAQGEGGSPEGAGTATAAPTETKVKPFKVDWKPSGKYGVVNPKGITMQEFHTRGEAEAVAYQMAKQSAGVKALNQSK